LSPTYGRHLPSHRDYALAYSPRPPHNASLGYDDRYYSSAPRIEPRRTGRGVTFDKALTQLAEAYETAEPVMAEFKAGFEADTGGIRLYADDETLDRLWHARVTYKTKPEARKGREREEEQGEDSWAGEELLLKSKEFQKALHALIKGLESAMNAVPTLGGKEKVSNKEKENMERMVKKLRPVSEECLKLARQAGKRVSQLQELLRELNYLKLMIEEWPEFTSAESRRRNEEGEEPPEDED
jgi:hypothetical protein